MQGRNLSTLISSPPRERCMSRFLYTAFLAIDGQDRGSLKGMTTLSGIESFPLLKFVLHFAY